MATTTKKTTSRPTNAKSKKKKVASLSPLSLFTRRYAVALVTVATFMIVGGFTLVWAMAATTTSSFWSTSTVPSTLSSTDSSSTEVGLRFKSDVAGYITGVRFYKSAQNTGIHTGNLWDNSGKLLATVTFTNETASGWQTANFSKPVSVAASTIYVISYHAPNGHYSYNGHYFSKAAYKKGHLTAVRDSASHRNGSFAHNVSSAAFPTSSAGGANYWVDVLFNTQLINPQPAPAAPTNVTGTAPDSTKAIITWQASVSTNPITNYTVYRDGVKLVDVGPVLTYTDTSVTANTTYSYQVRATDNAGTSSVLSVAASVTVPPATSTGGGTGGSTGGTTGWPDASNTGYPAGLQLHTCPTTITASGTYDACEFNGGVNITGVCTGSVKITRSLINGQVDVRGPGGYEFTVDSNGVPQTAPNAGCSDQGAVISDTTINCGCQSGSSAAFPATDTPPIVAGLNFTLLRDNIYNGGHGVAPDEFATIQDSYIHELGGNTDAHKDGLFISDGDHVTARHNNIECNDGSKAGCTAAIALLNDFSDETYMTFDNNLLNTNGAYCFYGGAKISAKPYQSSYITFTNNHFGRKIYPKCAYYGPVTYFDSTRPGMVWSGNVWDDTGAAVAPGN
jgi:hypothetical protein